MVYPVLQANLAGKTAGCGTRNELFYWTECPQQ